MKRDPSGYWKMIGVQTIKGGPGSGEQVGHPFRGNQYSTGEDDNEATDAPPYSSYERFGPPDRLSGSGDPDTVEGHAALRYSDERPTMGTAAEIAAGDKARKHLYQIGKTLLGNEEYAVSIDGKGQAYQYGGEEGVVSIDESDMRSMKHFIHSHPNETTFSSDDLYCLASFDNIRSAEVITKGGTVYRIDKKDGATFPMGFAGKLKQEWHEEMRSLSKKYGDLTTLGMPMQTAFEKHVGETMDRLMDKHKDKFTYTTTEVYYPLGKSNVPKKPDGASGKKYVIDDREIIPTPDYYDKKGAAT